MVVHLYFKGKRIAPVRFAMIISAIASNLGIGSSCNEEIEQRWITT